MPNDEIQMTKEPLVLPHSSFVLGRADGGALWAGFALGAGFESYFGYSEYPATAVRMRYTVLPAVT